MNPVVPTIAAKLAYAETGRMLAPDFDLTPWMQQADLVVRELDRAGLLVHDRSERSPATTQVAATTTRGVDMSADKAKTLDPAYTADREAWIEQHGSRRLKLAAERGYMHDGIYRDERLAVDLPGFRSVRKPKVKDIVNPSEEALVAEGEVLDKGYDARLVWINDSDDGDQGEAVEIVGYLGRHSIYLLVDEEGESS